MPKSISRKATLGRAALILLLLLGGVLYLLADRYLIEHVEIADVTIAIAAATEAASLQPSDANTISQTGSPPGLGQQAEGDHAAAIFADDWNYQRENLSIAIQKVSTGSGRNTITYFVADVVLANATQLRNAFAKNSFGRNIIAYTSQIARENNAIFAINGDYYGFRSDGIVIRNGVIYRDVPARTGLALYQDGSMQIFDETATSAQELLAAGVWNTLSFGPALIEDSLIADGLEHVEIDTNFGNRSIQGANPRTGIGVIDRNHFVFVVVDGRSAGYSKGVTLTEFAQIFKDLGCSQAYNIDGGGSSTLYFMGNVVNNPLGKNKERGTSDILYIGS